MKKQSALLILSSLFLLASCAGDKPAASSEIPSESPATSEADSNPASSASSSGVSSDDAPSSEDGPSSESASSEPVSAEELFKSGFASYLASTKKQEALATSSTYREGESVYSASFYKNEAVQTNPNGLQIVRSIEGKTYREFRLKDGALDDYSSVELTAENSSEYAEKVSFLFANNVYGLSGYLASDALDGYLEGGEGYSYSFEDGAFTLTSDVEDVSRCVLTVRDGAFASLSAEGSSSFSYSYENSGDKVADPSPVTESDFYYTDFTPSLVSENGKYFVGSTYSLAFASSNPKASLLVDPITALVEDDNEFVSYNKRNGTLKILKAGEIRVEFLSSQGVSKTLNLVAESEPIRSIRADQEGKNVHAGDSVKLTATVYPVSAAQDYSASITEGEEAASLSGSAEEGYTLKINDDAATGTQVTVTFESVASKEDGTKAKDSVTFQVVAKPSAPTGELAKKLIGQWQSQDVGHGVSDLTFNADGTGKIHYFSNEDGYETRFVFEWDGTDEDALAKDGTFFQTDENWDPIDSLEADYSFHFLKFADETVSLELYNEPYYAEENMDFTKAASEEPSLSEQLLGEWTSEDSYPASTLNLTEDGKGTVNFVSPADSYEAYFRFEWEASSDAILVKDGTFFELDGEGGDPLDEDGTSYELNSLTYADGKLTLVVNNLFGGEPEETLVFTKA